VAEARPICPGAKVTVKLADEFAGIVVGSVEVFNANALMPNTSVWIDMAGALATLPD
jgi:hypothetical protein